MTFWNIASRLARPQHKVFSVINHEQCRPATLTVCLARVSKRLGSRTQRIAR